MFVSSMLVLYDPKRSPPKNGHFFSQHYPQEGSRLKFQSGFGRCPPPHKILDLDPPWNIIETCTSKHKSIGEPASFEVAVITAIRTTSEREVDRQAVVVLVSEVRKAQAAVRNARHKQFKARLVSSSSSAVSGC